MSWGAVTRAMGFCVLVGAVCPSAWAAEPNLSFPVVLPEGEGLPARAGLSSSHLEGPWWYGWVEGEKSVLCAPSTCTPPPGVDAWRVYPQDMGRWQAGLMTGQPGDTVNVSEVDWGDGLESTTWSTASTVRVETTLYTVLSEPLPAYELLRLPGQEGVEAWGVKAANEDPSRPLPLDSGDATVLTPCARLTVQKLESTDSPARPREGRFRWDASTGEWLGASYTLVNGAVWEPGARGWSPVVDARGKALFRYEWEPGRAALPAHVSAAGWYRLTLSLDGSVAGGKRCGRSVLNTSMTEAETEAGEPYRAVVDAVWNLTYVDLYVRPAA